ncbi:MAG: hypothetical protein JWP74_3488 [Marmoricola sp.]|nr:hypothetical protein [Marmoricola sp.]
MTTRKVLYYLGSVVLTVALTVILHFTQPGLTLAPVFLMLASWTADFLKAKATSRRDR